MLKPMCAYKAVNKKPSAFSPGPPATEGFGVRSSRPTTSCNAPASITPRARVDASAKDGGPPVGGDTTASWCRHEESACTGESSVVDGQKEAEVASE